ncbi:divalent-cation tolerance protein CutA [Uliginosibacterium sp. sgz301328]|uniref:divalent-cation tolerance protein CutA n=1 Tax=Uliginosibacterium sp. sgz301328 TaxID=3243764 RepID=UPI00359E6F6D
MSADQTLLVISNTPDETVARRIAHALLERRLAACINVHSPCRSIYTWNGTVEEAVEVPLTIKTTAQCYPAVQELIRELHPYEVPEIVAIPVAGGLPQYLAWVLQSCDATAPPDTN